MQKYAFFNWKYIINVLKQALARKKEKQIHSYVNISYEYIFAPILILTQRYNFKKLSLSSSMQKKI